MSKPSPRFAVPRRATLAALLLATLVSTIAVLAARRQSTTFDEIFMVASGARGFETGRFNLARDHPPLMQYVYGLPVHFLQPTYPDEGRVWNMANRFVYARELYFENGNDPERLAFWTRLVAALLAGALVFTVFAWTAPRAGPGPALLAALLVGFTPDVLAHGGVAYNDVPIVLAFFLALAAIDRAVRDPVPLRVAIAAFAIGVAMSIKFSALALGPAALVMLAMEAVARGRDRAWWRAVGLGVPLAVGVFYLTLVLANRGDFSLFEYRAGLGWAVFHSGTGHSVPAFLLGERSATGFWYFYPVLFAFKTPVALHLLMLLAAGAGVYAWRARRAAEAPPRAWLTSPMRPMAVGAIVFAVVLLRANLNIGFRHALPLMPPLLVLTALGAAYAASLDRRLRLLAASLVTLFVVSTSAHYPNFLSYMSEYLVDRGDASNIVADSSLDWGQGLIQLREWMDENDVPRVYLSYFGSALPAAYDVDYVAMTSYFQIFTWSDAALALPREPEWMVISATNRAGIYLEDDPFAAFRNHAPVHVIANHLYVYPAPSSAR